MPKMSAPAPKMPKAPLPPFTNGGGKAPPPAPKGGGKGGKKGC